MRGGGSILSLPTSQRKAQIGTALDRHFWARESMVTVQKANNALNANMTKQIRRTFQSKRTFQSNREQERRSDEPADRAKQE